MTKQYPSLLEEDIPNLCIVNQNDRYFEGAPRALETSGVQELLGKWWSCKRDIVDVSPPQHVLHCGHNRGRNFTAYIEYEQRPEARRDIWGKLEVGYQPGLNLRRAQLDAA